LKAIDCERRAAETADPATKHQWEDLAMKWHLMANQAIRARFPERRTAQTSAASE
jgi:hypothetical protein